MFRIALASLVVLFSSQVRAEVIAESDTGVIFSKYHCEITVYELTDVMLAADYFDYLSAGVRWKYGCKGRDGRFWTFNDADRVIFPTARYNSYDQQWYVGDTAIAKRVDWRNAELLDGFFTSVSSNLDDGVAITFRVNIEQVEEEE